MQLLDGQTVDRRLGSGQPVQRVQRSSPDFSGKVGAGREQLVKAYLGQTTAN